MYKNKWKIKIKTGFLVFCFVFFNVKEKALETVLCCSGLKMKMSRDEDDPGNPQCYR